MAKLDFALNINRRRLLASAAALPAACVVPEIRCGGPLNPAGAAQPLSPPSTIPALNVSAATARRLGDIARRNATRQEASLPLLSVVRELRRMKEQDEQEEFERFVAAHGRAVLEGILQRRREEEGDPNWRPRWAESVGIGTRVRRVLMEQFNQARRERALKSDGSRL